MTTLLVHDVLPEKILVSRESARRLEERLREIVQVGQIGDSAAELIVDFSGVEGVAPSFLDELLGVFETVVRGASGCATRRLVVAHPPTRLSQKFEAAARGRGMSIQACSDGSWLFERKIPTEA